MLLDQPIVVQMCKKTPATDFLARMKLKTREEQPTSIYETNKTKKIIKVEENTFKFCYLFCFFK